MQNRNNTGDKDDHLGAALSLDYCFRTPVKVVEDTKAVLVCYDHDQLDLWTPPVEGGPGGSC